MSTHLLSAEEQEELKTAIAEAEAEEQGGEPDKPEPVKAEPAKPDTEKEVPAKADAEAAPDDAPLPQLEDEDTSKPDRVQLMVADDAAEAEKEIEQIKRYRADLHKKFREGEIDSEDYQSKLDEAQDRLVDLTTAVREAQLVARNNEVATKQLWMSTVDDYRSQYKELQTKSVNAAWDFHIKAMKDDPKVKEMLAAGEQPGKVFRYVLKEAHKTVRTELGLGAKPAEERKGAAPPQTLAGLPQATPSNTGSDEFADIDAMTGEDAELALARMPADKKQRYLMRA